MSLSSTTNSNDHQDEAVRDGLIVAPDTLPGPLSYGLAILVVLLFCVLTFGTGVVDTLWPLPEPKLIGIEAQKAQAAQENARFLDGSLARLIEDRWKRRSRVRGVVGAPYAYYLYRWLNEGSSDLIIGKDGWLFLKERVYPRADSDESIALLGASRAACLQRRFAKRGCRLITIPIPRKSVIAAKYLPRGVLARPRIDSLLVRYAWDLDVECIDLVGPLMDTETIDNYYQWDSHWSHLGQRRSAYECCRQSGLLVDEKDSPFKLYDALDPAHVGRDLLASNGITGEYFSREVFESKVEHFTAVVGQVGPNKSWWILNKDERGLERVVCGTSFTDDRSFWQFLSFYGGKQVENASLPGSRPETVMREFLKRRLESLPRVLFWEMPNHYLTGPGGGRLSHFYSVYRRLIPKSVCPLPQASSKSTYRGSPGKKIATSTWKVMAEWNQSPLPHDGTGTVLLAIRGRGKGLRFAIKTGKKTTILNNVSLNAGAILFPLLAGLEENGIEVSVRSESGAAENWELAEVTLVADGDLNAALRWQRGKVERTTAGDYRQMITFGEDTFDGPSIVLLQMEGSPKALELIFRGQADEILKTWSLVSPNYEGEILIDVPWARERGFKFIEARWRGRKESGIQDLKWMPLAD